MLPIKICGVAKTTAIFFHIFNLKELGFRQNLPVSNTLVSVLTLACNEGSEIICIHHLFKTQAVKEYTSPPSR